VVLSSSQSATYLFKPSHGQKPLGAHLIFLRAEVMGCTVSKSQAALQMFLDYMGWEWMKLNPQRLTSPELNGSLFLTVEGLDCTAVTSCPRPYAAHERHRMSP